MNRLLVEDALMTYINTLSVLTDPMSNQALQLAYRARLDVARCLLSRWRGGESKSRMADAVRIELELYQCQELSGTEADIVRYFLRKLCRSLEIDIRARVS